MRKLENMMKGLGGLFFDYLHRFAGPSLSKTPGLAFGS
jgi:hypothetical protein